MSKGLVKFDEERCKGCELCISVCPVKILTLHETRINSKGYRPACVTDVSKCIGCANCAVMCPDGAISVYNEAEMSSTSLKRTDVRKFSTAENFLRMRYKEEQGGRKDE